MTGVQTWCSSDLFAHRGLVGDRGGGAGLRRPVGEQRVGLGVGELHGPAFEPQLLHGLPPVHLERGERVQPGGP